MPSKELGDKIRALLEANPGCEVVCVTNGNKIAYINKYVPVGSPEAVREGFETEGVFIGECSGEDYWGDHGNYFPSGAPSKYHDLVGVHGVAS